MKTLVGIELQKIFRKWRTYIGFMAIAVLVPIVQISMYYAGDNYLKAATRGLSDSFMMVGNLFNGYLVAHIILGFLIIHVPFLIVLVGGDLLAGEATAGTYRVLITRPVSRSRILASKFLAGIIYVLSLLAFLALVSLGISMLIFGTGELVVLKGQVIIFSANDVLWRFGAAYAYAALSMITVLTLSFFFSSMVENAIGPIVATMAVIIIFTILSFIPVEFLENLRPYFFTTHMAKWEGFFGDPVEWTEIFRSALVLAGHIAGLYLITMLIFLRKDILT